MLNLKSIEIKNFRSYGNSPVLFEFNNGMTLIKGLNREGKSSTIMAITYALFGKIKGITIKELVNSINKSNLLVKLVFEINDIEYKIVRGDFPKVFDIYKNNKKIESNNRIQTEQELLERDILGISLNTYNTLISLDSTLISKSFFTMSKNQRKTFLEEILDIKILYYLAIEAKTKMNIISTNKIDKEYQYKNVMNSIDAEEQRLNEIKQINEDLMNTSKNQIQELNDCVSKYRINIEELEKELNDISKIETKYREFKKEIQEMIEKKNIFIKQGKTESSRYKKKNNVKKVFQNCIGCNKLSSIITCKIDDITINNIKDDINTKKEEIIKIMSIISDKESECKSLEDRINSKYAVQSNIDKYFSLIKHNQNEIVKINNYKIWPEDTFKLDTLKSEKEDILQELSNINKDKKSLEIILELVSDNGIKKQIFTKYIPLFNSYLNKYIAKFDLPYNILFNELFEVKILERGVERNYMSFSGSEKLRLSLAIIFSFVKLVETRNAFSINIMAIDELLDGTLSSDNVDLILQFLKDNFKNKEILAISHRQLDKEIFDRIYQIKKINNFTKILKGE